MSEERHPTSSEAAADDMRSGWRVSVAPGEWHATDDELVVAVADAGRRDGREILVDGLAAEVVLDRRDPTRAVLVEGGGPTAWRTPILFGPPGRQPDGAIRRELVVDGWRVEVTVEQARRAELRARAQALGATAAGGEAGDVRAMIPGKIVAVDVGPGDTVIQGQRVLVLEAMKMQNELHAPVAGVVERVTVEPGANVERDELLIVIR